MMKNLFIALLMIGLFSQCEKKPTEDKVSDSEVKGLQDAAKKILMDFPSDADIDSLGYVSDMSKDALKRGRVVFNEISTEKTFTKSQYDRLLNEFFWFEKFIISAHLRLKNTGSSPTTCVDCIDAYDACTKGLGCNRGDWICLCCMPCSADAVRCAIKCTTGKLSGSVIYY